MAKKSKKRDYLTYANPYTGISYTIKHNTNHKIELTKYDRKIRAHAVFKLVKSSIKPMIREEQNNAKPKAHPVA